MWNNEGHSFANQFERKAKDGRWRGLFWIHQPTPRELQDPNFSSNCVCHGRLSGQEIFIHFDMEVEVITKFLEEKFGKIKLLNVGKKLNNGWEMKLFMIKFWDNEGVCRLDTMTEEQLELLKNHGRLIREEVHKRIEEIGKTGDI